jgi:hypothetical protein
MIPKNIVILSIIGACAICGDPVRAQHVWEDPNAWAGNHFTYDTKSALYSSQEISMDLFASYINPEGEFHDLFETSIRNGFWGGGAGVNYFFTRELGIGGDFNISSKPDDATLLDQATGNLIFRLPIGNSGIAPYAIGSGGRSMSPRWDWVYGGGVGLEFRFNPTTGVFSDARFLLANHSDDPNRLLIRAGVRITF